MIDWLLHPFSLTVIAVWLAIQLLFVLYVFAMAVQRVYEEGRMTAWHWAATGGWVLIALAWDIFLNYTILAALTLDFPRAKEWTFSKRLERLVRSGGFRAGMAKRIAFILDPFDPSGKHIK